MQREFYRIRNESLSPHARTPVFTSASARCCVTAACHVADMPASPRPRCVVTAPSCRSNVGFRLGARSESAFHPSTPDHHASRSKEQRAAVDRQPFLSEIKPPSPLDKANRGAESERGESHQRRSRPLSPTQSARPKKAREQTAVCHKKTDFLFRADQAFSRYYERIYPRKPGEIAAGKTRQPRICNFK